VIRFLRLLSLLVQCVIMPAFCFLLFSALRGNLDCALPCWLVGWLELYYETHGWKLWGCIMNELRWLDRGFSLPR